MQRSIGRSRVLLVLLMSLGLLLGSAATPAAATGGGEGDDTETIRAQTIGTIDYKAGLLTDLKNGADNADRGAVYDDGIAQLSALRESAAIEPDIQRLRDMDAQAHSIYHDTKARASAVGQTEEEKIAQVRMAALETINYKLGVFRDAREKTDDSAHREIYADAVGQLEGLKVAAEGSNDIVYLEQLKSQAHEIYNVTKARIGESGGDKGKEPKQEEPKKTEAEKAAEALVNARRSTLRLIEHKISILTHGADAAKNPAVARIYEKAAEDIAVLTEDAENAPSVGALKEIDAQIMEVYRATQATVAETHGKPDWQPSEAIKGYLDAIERAVKHLVAGAESSADKSPETAAAVSKAGVKAIDKAERVRASCESGNELDTKWADLEGAVHTFRKALREHVAAVTGEPAYVNGWHLPG